MSKKTLNQAIAEKAGHALDLAPVNSKIVVTEHGAVLAAPDGLSLLAKSDPASKLPRGAKILKVAEARYVSTQLDAALHPDTTHATATDAIAAFFDDFHPRGG